MFPLNVKLKNGEILTVRRACAADLEQYAQVSIKCYQETRFLSRCPEDPAPSLSSLLGFIEDVERSNREILLVAVYKEEIVGFGDITACLNRKKMSHKCDLSISVLKDYWSIGIGSTILQALIDFAYKAGYEQINLNVASDNQNAIQLYSKNGFEITGREIHAMKHRDNDYSDWVFMTKFLN